MELVNKIDNKEIYANRATNDKNGNDITTAYQRKLTAGSNITIDENNVISSTGGGGEGKTYNASTPDYIAVDNDNNTIGLTESPTTLVAGNGLEISTEGDNVILNVTYAPYAGEAANVQCNNGLINYEATGEDNTGFYVGNYLGNVEVRIADHSNNEIEQWYWDKSGIGCRETKDRWGYYSKLTKDDLQFTTDGGYTPSMSFKQLWDEVHGVVLWEGSANNSVTSITLSESVANFEKIKIVFRNNDNYYSSVEIPSDAPKTILNGGYINDANVTFYGKMRNADLNGNVIDIPAAKQIRITSAGAVTVSTENAIIVLKVIGYGRKG